jgi:hypothetical protein
MASHPGKCVLCGAQITTSSATRHLGKCVPDHDPKNGVATKLLELRVQSPELPFYWLQVQMKSTASLATLDTFLRKTWLECCGHLSQFIVNRTLYQSSLDRTWDYEDARSMACKAERIFAGVGTTVVYQYDFGSTTELKIKLVGEREAPAGRQAVRLLARNDPPPWACECGDPATRICSCCGEAVCEVHGDEHECGEEMLLPIVNSPRTGVCGYVG